jgi:hypothetical protein
MAIATIDRIASNATVRKSRLTLRVGSRRSCIPRGYAREMATLMPSKITLVFISVGWV